VSNDRLFHFVCNSHLVCGAGARGSVGACLDDLSVRRTHLVASERFLKSSLSGDIIDSIQEKSDLAGVWSDIEPHSSLRAVAALGDELLRTGADGVVVVGGGSAICLAKLAVAVASERKPLDDLLWSYSRQSGRFTFPPMVAPKLPIVALPTTSGSAAETNKSAGVKDERTSRRVGVQDHKLIPRFAILDPELTATMDPVLTAGTGANALAHCIEALYSVEANPGSTWMALSAARQIVICLPRCVEHPNDLEARSTMQMATAFSGIAFGNAKVGIHHGLCHALAARGNVPHGQANFIMLPHALRFNAEGSLTVRQAIVEFGQTSGLVDFPPGQTSSKEASSEVIDRLADWLARLGAPTRIRDLGLVRREDLRTFAEDVFDSHNVPNNPRRIDSADELLVVFDAAW
jgi:alcohol dehydrogenase